MDRFGPRSCGCSPREGAPTGSLWPARWALVLSRPTIGRGVAGVEGWRFSDGDAADLARGIERAYRQRERLRELGARARTTAEARADWSKNFPLLLDAYRLALGQEPPR